jgi:hypothetical protein
MYTAEFNTDRANIRIKISMKKRISKERKRKNHQPSEDNGGETGKIEFST